MYRTLSITCCLKLWSITGISFRVIWILYVYNAVSWQYIGWFFLQGNRNICTMYRLFEIRQTERAENHKDRQYCQICQFGCPTKIFVCVFFFCTGNRKCNWYAGTITVNSELDSASNGIYFLNMQLFPW